MFGIDFLRFLIALVFEFFFIFFYLFDKNKLKIKVSFEKNLSKESNAKYKIKNRRKKFPKSLLH